MNKYVIRNKVNRFYTTLATTDMAYNNYMVTVEDLDNINVLNEILFDLESNFFTYEDSRKLYKSVLKLLDRTKKNRIYSNILRVAAVVVSIWLVASYFEIVFKNTTENPQYSKANMIVNFVEEATNND